MKVAPEHSTPPVLQLMGKQDITLLLKFKTRFDSISRESGKKQFLTYYFIAAHPGCRQADMMDVKKFAAHKLKITPEQVQIFTPSPSTWSTVMYHTGINPSTMKSIFVEKNLMIKNSQKQVLTKKYPRKSL